MNLYLLLVTLTIVNAGVVPDTECDGVIIDDKYYDKEILKTGLDRPFHLVVDYGSNIIYFSYNVNETAYKSALFDINTKQFKDINDVPNGYTQTIDQNDHGVYIGGDNGIYKYDHKNHKSELYSAKGKDICKLLYYAGRLYFTKKSDEVRHIYSIYSYRTGRVSMLGEMSQNVDVKDFDMDSDDIIFSTNDSLHTTKIFHFWNDQKKGGDSKYGLMNNDKLKVRALAVGRHGGAYMCSDDTIYKINKNRIALEKLINVGDCRGLAFDNDDNIIYSDVNSLVRLKIKKDKVC